jgi:2-polyprenyl-6-hydroxyphenyl methylase/3-demethylubiquinone-9 3-methyltransferase
MTELAVNRIMQSATPEYRYNSAQPTWANSYLWPKLRSILSDKIEEGSRIFEVGCGSGATAAMMSQLGYSVTAIDPSSSGIQLAREAYPHIRFEERSAYDDLVREFGTFDAVVSLEVIEHCYWPRKFADAALGLLKPGGIAVISTPFHGYWKNLALSISGRFDSHWSPLWDGGHIKFWSEKTLRALLDERGFEDIGFARAGRVPPLAKSMIAVARRPK